MHILAQESSSLQNLHTLQLCYYCILSSLSSIAGVPRLIAAAICVATWDVGVAISKMFDLVKSESGCIDPTEAADLTDGKAGEALIIGTTDGAAGADSTIPCDGTPEFLDSSSYCSMKDAPSTAKGL